MKAKKLISTLLLIFVIFSVVFLIKGEASKKKEEKAHKEEIPQQVNTAATEKESEPSAQSLEKETKTNNEKAPENLNVPAENNKEKNNPPSQSPKKEEVKKKVLAYYFHGTYRCPTCLTIERYSREAIEQNFAQELGDGRLEFKSINVEEPGNQHYVQDYQLYTKSLIIILQKDNKQIEWKNLNEVWSYVHNKENFYQYVKNEVEQFLEEAE